MRRNCYPTPLHHWDIPNWCGCWLTWNLPRKDVFAQTHTHSQRKLHFPRSLSRLSFFHIMFIMWTCFTEKKRVTTPPLLSSLPHPSLPPFSHQAVDTINFLPWIKVQTLASENGSFRHGVSVSRQNASLVSSGSRYFFSALFFFPSSYLEPCPQSSLCCLLQLRKKEEKKEMNGFWGHVRNAQIAITASLYVCVREK